MAREAVGSEVRIYSGRRSEICDKRIADKRIAGKRMMHSIPTIAESMRLWYHLQHRTVRQPVNVKVGVEREQDLNVEALGYGHDRCICQVHRSVAILVHQLGHPIHVVSVQVAELREASLRRPYIWDGWDRCG